MTDPTLKITYFNGRGRAEPMRLACTIGDLEYTDDRFEFPKFADVKAQTPYGAVPTMEVDGTVYAQSLSLLRYLGKLASLYPESPLEALKVDEIVDTCEDFLNACFSYRGPDKDKLREARDHLVEVDVPRFIGGLEKRLAATGDGPWAVGGEMTIADLCIANTVNNAKTGFLDFVNPTVLDGYSRIMESYNAVMCNPKVAQWYSRHPLPNVEVPSQE